MVNSFQSSSEMVFISLSLVVLDCQQRGPPTVLSIPVMHMSLLPSRWSLFSLPLNVGWPRDLLWSVECGSDPVPGPALGLKKPDWFHFHPDGSSHHETKSNCPTGQRKRGPGGWKMTKGKRGPPATCHSHPFRWGPCVWVKLPCFLQSQMSHPSQHHTERKWAVPTQPCQITELWANIQWWLL